MKRVLLVDDDPTVLHLISAWLRRTGFEVQAVGDFETASALLRGHPPELLVADVRLGPFNGLHLALLARQRDPSMPILIISGWDDAVLRREAELLGARYLTKPFGAPELLAAIAAAGMPLFGLDPDPTTGTNDAFAPATIM